MTTILRPPGPAPRERQGSRRAFIETPVSFIVDIARRFGDIAYFRVGTRDHYLLSNPDDIKDVLVTKAHRFIKAAAPNRGLSDVLGESLLTSEGEVHRRRRRLAQPAFHHSRIVGYADAIAEYTDRLLTSIRPGEERDMHTDMSRLAVGAVAKALFGTDLSDEVAHHLLENLTTLSEACNRLSQRQVTLQSAHYREVTTATYAILERIIDDRRAQAGDRGDLLSMLLLATDEEGDGTGFTDVQVRDEVITFVFAGHDTTANAMTWAWYLLSQNPEAEARLHEELGRVLGGRPPTIEDLEDLPYLDMVIQETLRLYPPAWTMDRVVVEDHEVGGFVIPTSAIVLMCQYSVQRDPRWYPDPDRFEPERWLPEARAARPRYSYFPFGGGQRICIGQHFALTEMALVIGTLAQRWRFEVARDQRVAIEPLAALTLRPTYGMRMVAVPRG